MIRMICGLFLAAALSLPMQAQPEVKAFIPALTQLKWVQSLYPEAAKQQGIQGIVEILATIDPRGLVTAVEPLSGPDLLRQSAMDTARNWTFHPVIRDGAPVYAMTWGQVNFNLNNGQRIGTGDANERAAAAMRISALTKQFPRTPAIVFADMENAYEGFSEAQIYPFLPALAKAAVNTGDLPKASLYANQLLNLAAQNPKNNGDAIHDGNMVLGRVALAQNKALAAAEYLLAAGRTSGSPVLNSFGPNMSLAKALIEDNQRDVVLHYFELCRSFWKMGGKKLDDWTAMVKGGGQPSFGANLVY